MLPSRPRLLLSLTILALLCSGCMGGWKLKPAGWSNATGAEQFERLWWADVQKKKWEDVRYRLAATFVWISAEAKRDREQTMAHLEQLEIEDFTLGDVEVRPNGNDVVVTYTMTMRGTLAGRPIALERTPMMTVWQQQKAGWTAIARSTAGASPL